MQESKVFTALVFGLSLLASNLGISARTTILISCDGFRWDYPQFYDTPFLDAMAEKGVSGELVPSFPSKTFPNHYTLATGLRPEHHGIIANTFMNRKTGEEFSLSDPKAKFDPQYYKGEPLWLTAQRQGKHAAVFYWPGSDVAVQGKRPDVWHAYDEKPHMTFAQRMDSIMAYLMKADAPDLIMAYFEEPDASGHKWGPQSRQVRHAVERMDSLLAALWSRIEKAKLQNGVNLVVVSDHGMTWFTPSRQIHPSQYLKENWYEKLDGSLPTNIYASQKWQQDSIAGALEKAPHLRVWRKADIPDWLHYKADTNIGDVLVLPDEGFLFTDDSCYNGGVHGYAPALSDMHAIFRACGPDVRPGVAIGQFSNTAVYPLVCQLLGIKPAANDGENAYNAIKDKTFK